MKWKIGPESKDAEKLIPPAQPDGSGVGINYADAYLKALGRTLEDGRKVAWKRRGLKITLTVGERKGEGLMRRVDRGPDARVILREALREAASAAGVSFSVEGGEVVLEES